MTDILNATSCPKCGLEAKTLLHRFCQNKDCPVRVALAEEPKRDDLREAADHVLAAFSEGVVWNDEQRVAYERLHRAMSSPSPRQGVDVPEDPMGWEWRAEQAHQFLKAYASGDGNTTLAGYDIHSMTRRLAGVFLRIQQAALARSDAAPDAVGEALQALRDILFMRPAGPVEKTKSAWKILEAIENRAKAALATVADRRSFPEAGDGRPISNTAAELFGAGCDPETASFVARQLERKGLVLARAEDRP